MKEHFLPYVVMLHVGTPVIVGAGILEIPKLAKSGMNGLFQMSLVGGLASVVFAYITVWLMMR
ncbi:hypothetical protein [Paenibacillus sp.]|uniref:hypothetical protein n=1 Tax=Paenibacillus sp. TaxID=58172 RepID=UPI00281949D4|nr:hypothetical protein [Paenibacillus sp.]MDR0268676.1 hypothetical protein [Paenibacillus sp.]